MPAPRRRLFVVFIDAFLLPIAVLAASGFIIAPASSSFVAAGSWLLPAGLLIGLPLYVCTSQYKGLTRYVGSASLYDVAWRNGLLVLLLAGIGVILSLPMQHAVVDFAVVVAYWIIRCSALCFT